MACIERRSGVFLSRASPLYEQNAVGIQRIVPVASSLINAGEVISQTVYPRASNVARRPPDGNDEASASPLTSSLPESSIIIFPVLSGCVTKESCFSAVVPVSG